MTDLAETRPRPSRRGFLFYTSAAVAAHFGVQYLAPVADPVFEAIERMLRAKFAVDTSTGTDEELKPIYQAYDREVWALSEVKPTTKEGRRALLQAMFKIEDPNSWDRECPMVQTLIGIVNAEYGLHLTA